MNIVNNSIPNGRAHSWDYIDFACPQLFLHDQLLLPLFIQSQNIHVRAGRHLSVSGQANVFSKTSPRLAADAIVKQKKAMLIMED